MSDELEDRLRETLHQTLPPAPTSLADAFDDLPRRSLVRRRIRGVGRELGSVAAVAVLLVVAGAVVLGTRAPAVPVATSSSASGSPSPSPTAVPSGPATIDGLPLLTVSEAIARHAAGAITNDSVALRGYWSGMATPHGCNPPSGTPGDLELACLGDEYGITELDEPMLTLTNGGHQWLPHLGPALMPFIGDIEPRLPVFGPMVNGQPYRPVPIVVVGHFDDPRAANCRSEAKQLCLDRFVLERVVSFDPESVPTPGVTLPPSPFPYEDPPPAKFNAAQCKGDVPYSFVGWTTFADLGLDLGGPTDHVYAMVTRDPIENRNWRDDPGRPGHRSHIIGRRICYSNEWDTGSIVYDVVPGSAFVEWDDGRRIPYQP